MKHEQVIPDYAVMLESSITILALVGCGWLLFKLVSACFWFPQYMKGLEKEAEKVHQHMEKTLLPPKKPKKIVEEVEEEETSNKEDEEEVVSDNEEPEVKSSPEESEEPEEPQEEFDDSKKDK